VSPESCTHNRFYRSGVSAHPAAARTIGHPGETNRLDGSSVRGADGNKIMTDRSTTARPDPQERATELFFLLTIGAALHLLMLGEAAIPVMAGLFLEINPLILGTMIAAFFIHEATAMWDVRYAVTAREITPLEQHVHSFLEMVPLTALSLISLLHWPQLKTLIGLRREKFEPLRKKAQPLGTAYALLTLRRWRCSKSFPISKKPAAI
jgi:hypothetical protein